MGNRDVSVVFKASDRLSDSLHQMRKGVRGLESDVEHYKKVQQQVFQEKAQVKLDITQAKQSMKELEKAVRSGSDGAREAFLAQQTKLESLNNEYKRLTKLQSEALKSESLNNEYKEKIKQRREALESLNNEYKEQVKLQKEVLRGEKEFQTTMSRNSNANAGAGLSGAAGMMKSLAKAGLGSMLGGAVGDLMGGMTTSAFGSTVGGAIGSIGGNALSGAAIGSIAGPIGTAVGAAVGGLTGAIQALNNRQQQADDLFRNEVQSLYNTTTAEMQDKISNGSAYAAERENYKRNYASMTDDETGKKLYESIMKYGDTTPYDTSVMLGKGMEMLSYGIDKKNVPEFMDIIGNIAMGDANKFSGLSYAISQSMAAGKLNAQDKNQMVGYGFNPLEYVAKNKGISIAEASELMSDGKITSDMLVEALRTATSEGERYHDAVNAMSDTFSGLQGQLESAKKNIEIAMGEGYNEARKKGMEKEIEAYNGDLGEKMKNAYSMVGAYEAEMENQYQQSIINAMQDATKRIEEEGLTGIEAEKVMWEAKTQAEIDYKNSEEYQKKLQAEKSLVANIQSSLTESGEYVKFGQAMADQFSKGWQSGRLSNAASDVRAQISKEGVSGYINSIFANAYKGTPGGVSSSRKHAAGLKRVPYDGYVAELHEGERVLTRVEADKRSGGSVTIAKLADQIVVREEADIDKIARALVRNMQNMRESFVGA
ncbi:tape measure protein [Anaerotignum faecicola]